MRKKPIVFRVVASEEGMMLANMVARRVAGVSLTRAKELIGAGAVYVGGKRIRIPSLRLFGGERVTVHTDADTEHLDPSMLCIVHHDPAFVIIDKPFGVPVTATRQSARGTVSDALLRHLQQQGHPRPYVGVVHRLDRGASGLVLFTTRTMANRSIHRQFEHHEIHRVYRLRLLGELPDELVCTAPLRERPGERVQIARANEPGGRAAETRFRRLTTVDGPHGPESLVEAELTTGRMHQIRVHAAAAGFPVRGDARYGRGSDERLFLHAWRLSFRHPISGESICVQSELPLWAMVEPDEHPR